MRTSFAVFISRKSGTRVAKRGTSLPIETQIELIDELMSTSIPDTEPGLQLAQLSLIRCRYLIGELSLLEPRTRLHLAKEIGLIHTRTPEAYCMLSRSIVETALVGSYLAIEQGDYVDQMMKTLQGSAKRMRDRFLSGDHTAALRLLSDLKFISEPLNPALDGTRKALDIKSLCERLDKVEPFSNGGYASRLYDETYSLLSNHVVHPTPFSLRRHQRLAFDRPPTRLWTRMGRRPSWTRMRGPTLRPRTMSPPPAPVEEIGAGWAAGAATVALAASLARGLGKPNSELDAGLSDIEALDGYFWSGSPAGMMAAAQLAELVGLPSTSALNHFGFLIRMFAATDIFRTLSYPEQLIATSEVIDRMRDHPSIFKFILSKGRPLKSAQCTPEIAAGSAATHPQSLTAALALVYAAAWPDSPNAIQSRLEDMDRLAPHDVGVLHYMMSHSPGLRGFVKIKARSDEQVARMP
jgi:hypothetical protein